MAKDEDLIEGFNKLAQVYQDKFMDMDLYDDTYDEFCRLIEGWGTEVLEIGCGPGNITRYILNKLPELNIHAIDLSEEMVALARENNPRALVEVMDCRDINRLTLNFDAVIGGFCLPYLNTDECRQLLKDCHRLLSDDGICYFSVIGGDYEQSGLRTTSDGQFRFIQYYYDEKMLSDIIVESGFKVLSVFRKHYSDQDNEHLILIARRM